MRAALLLLTTVLATTPAGVDARPSHLSLGVRSWFPAALETGTQVGVSAWLTWDAAGPLLLGLHTQAGSTTESNLTYAVTHTEVRAGASAELVWRAGPGAVLAGLDLGLVGLRELRERHQAGRLPSGAAGSLPSAWALGAQTTGRFGARLSLGEYILLDVAAGPEWSFMPKDDALGVRFGWAGDVLLGWAF